MKYVLTDEGVEEGGLFLYRIQALRSFGGVRSGELGGYVESDYNLSHDGDCWVSGDAKVYGNARVSGDSRVSGDARIFGTSYISGEVCISGTAHVSGDSWITGTIEISGDVWVAVSRYKNSPIYGDLKLDHGTWTGYILLRGNYYLLSPTLETMSVKKYV